MTNPKDSSTKTQGDCPLVLIQAVVEQWFENSQAVVKQ
jgi:hypothetical protein